jgi:CheY-like chemotaxis protein
MNCHGEFGMSDEPRGPTDGAKKDTANNVVLGILQIIVSLIGALAWPLAVIYLVGVFSGPIGRLIDRSNSATVEVPGGGKVSLAAVAASAAAVGAAASKQDISAQQAVQNISGGFVSQTGDVKPLNQGKILWVDDNPDNNTLLINAFKQLGIQVTLALSTEQAEALLGQSQFDVVISDMDRPPDHEAGETLLKWMQARALKTPVIIYAAQWAAANAGRESEIGALKITNDPSVVYHLALRAIQGGVSASMTDASPGGMPR